MLERRRVCSSESAPGAGAVNFYFRRAVRLRWTHAGGAERAGAQGLIPSIRVSRFTLETLELVGPFHVVVDCALWSARAPAAAGNRPGSL